MSWTAYSLYAMLTGEHFPIYRYIDIPVLIVLHQGMINEMRNLCRYNAKVLLENDMLGRKFSKLLNSSI